MHTTTPYVAQVIAAQREEEILRAATDRRLSRRLARRTRPLRRPAADL